MISTLLALAGILVLNFENDLTQKCVYHVSYDIYQHIFFGHYRYHNHIVLRVDWICYFCRLKKQTKQNRIFHDNLTLPKSTEKCWLKRDLNSHLRDTCPPLFLLSCRVHRDWRRVFIQLKRKRYSPDNLTLIHERMCSFSFLFQNHPQRYTSRNFSKLKNWKISIHVSLRMILK